MKSRVMSRGQLLDIALFIAKHGTLDPVTKVTFDDVTVMISWLNISGISIMSKISNMSYMTFCKKA